MSRQRIGQVIGFEGTVFASSFDNEKVIKEIPLFKKRGPKKTDVTENHINNEISIG
jgi:hypothetical protein